MHRFAILQTAQHRQRLKPLIRVFDAQHMSQPVPGNQIKRRARDHGTVANRVSLDGPSKHSSFHGRRLTISSRRWQDVAAVLLRGNWLLPSASPLLVPTVEPDRKWDDDGADKPLPIPREEHAHPLRPADVNLDVPVQHIQ